MTMCFEAYVNLSRAFFFSQHLNTRCNYNSPPDKYQVIPPPTCPKLLIYQNSLHKGIIDWEVFVARFTRGQRSLREDRNWCGEVTFLATEQESVHFTLWKRNKVRVLHWHPAPSPDLSVALRSLSRTLDETRCHLSERSNQGEDKSLDSFH